MAGHTQTMSLSGKNANLATAVYQLTLKMIFSGAKERLQTIIGAQVAPIFTPPWNRCSQSTLHILKNAGFKAVSRSCAATPESAPLFADFQVNVDLHTRKEPDHTSCLSALGSELKKAASSGRIGIMIHHQRMNRNSFTVLENLLAFVAENELLQAVHFNHLLD